MACSCNRSYQYHLPTPLWAGLPIAATHRRPLGGSYVYYCLYFDFFCSSVWTDFSLLIFLKKKLHANFQPRNFQRAVWTASESKKTFHRRRFVCDFSPSIARDVLRIFAPALQRTTLRHVFYATLLMAGRLGAFFLPVFRGRSWSGGKLRVFACFVALK